MSMREKIADLLVKTAVEYDETGEGPSSTAMADAILAILPDFEEQQARIDKLEGGVVFGGHQSGKTAAFDAGVTFGRSQQQARDALKEDE
tara:strand:+ start:813 stop:1082 length:270 start_codon:yes stop_codon:yes gene_type:complete